MKYQKRFNKLSSFGHDRPIGVRWLVVLLLGMATLMSIRCTPLDRIAPPVDLIINSSNVSQPSGDFEDSQGEGGHRLGGFHEHDSAVLAHGREIYLTKCSRCHSPEPIDRYAMTQWHNEILPDMVDEARLDDQQEADLTAYLVVAHQYLTTTKTPGTSTSP